MPRRLVGLLAALGEVGDQILVPRAAVVVPTSMVELMGDRGGST